MIRQPTSFSAFTVFKDLVSKMLNPSRQLRATIQQIEKHPWVLGAFIEEFPAIDERWKQETLQRLAKLQKLSVDDVNEKLASDPYGKLGGVFNIEKHRHQLNMITMKKAPSRLNVINHIISISIYPSQISTLLCRALYREPHRQLIDQQQPSLIFSYQRRTFDSDRRLRTQNQARSSLSMPKMFCD